MMHIAFCTDTNYIMPTGVAMISVCENNLEESICFHLVITDEGTSPDEVDEKVKPLAAIAEKYGKEYKIYRLSSETLKEYVCSGADYISTTAFARIFLPILLHESIKKVLYLDCDVAVNSSLRELWSISLDNDCLVGAVPDIHGNSVKRRITTHLPRTLDYCNSGVLLINLESWRNENLVNKALDLGMEKQGLFPMLDQDVINVLCQNRIQILPLKNNFQTLLFFERDLYWMIDADYYKEAQELIKAPSKATIIHYVTPNKPWGNELCPLREIWKRYQNFSVWKDFPLTQISTRFDRTKQYEAFLQSYWADSQLFIEVLPYFLRLFNASVKLKNKRLFLRIAMFPLSVMAWFLEIVYQYKTKSKIN